MRSFIRHPTDIPINCVLQDHYYCIRNALLDISAGGLSFSTDYYLPPGELIQVNIYVKEPSFEATCKVMWCKKVDNYYHVGVKFENEAEAFGFRMVEQVCHIEHYKRYVLNREGRDLDGQEAAEEWIQKYASEFPR